MDNKSSNDSVPKDLNKVDKENFKNALNTIKDLEELIKDSFQLTQFS